jgi:hypothetical protein
MAHENSDSFDALLAQMPRIAEAVKAFPEAVQPQAFEHLIAAARGGAARSKKQAPSTTELGGTKAKKRRARNSRDDGEVGRPRRRQAGSPYLVRDLDLTPEGKTCLKDFVAEKQPKTNHDQNVLSVYYLAEVLGIGAVSVDHVFTCYRDMRCREPASLANSLAVTANRKRFIDTANLDAIKLTPPGRNHVLHDLPPKQQGK